MKPDDKLTSKHAKWILATFLAWTFDLYDLFSILLVTPYIAELFFPSKVVFLAIAATYATFLTSFLMRPVGALYFGNNISDKLGRKKAILYGIIGLVITASLQGALPTYAVVGIFAPILIILVRLAEGFFVGGVTAGSHTIGPESVPERHRGWVGGIGFSAAGAAYLIASAWFYMTALLFPGSSYLVWGWRVMFFGGLLPLAVLGFVNYLVPESDAWQKVKERGKTIRSPVRELFSKYRRTFGIALVLTIGWALMYYLTQGLFPTFLSKINGLTKAEIGITMIIASIGMIIGPALGGEISQHIGRKLMSILGAVIVIAISPLYLYLGSLSISSLNNIILVTFLISLLSDFGGGMLMTYLNEAYPTNIRGTGVAFTWNSGFAIGGASPTIISLVLASIGASKFPLVMFYALLIVGVILLISSVISKDTKGNILKEIESAEKGAI
ncbi:MFS transporter [Sulfolobus sp. S-194]|uniref:MFS transporter n=1 Tax=Sulfolobus sp. S-194 TaxID=2512240 RepID=UPI001437259F|nr:MFS transporter [Sulfolobus sp. S-194]